MSTSSNISLGSLRLQAQQRSDLENNNFVTTSEWNGYISQEYKSLYDLLVGCYGNDYFVATTYQFQTSAAQSYPLPDGTPSFQNTSGGTAQKFYKLLGVDLQYSASPSGWVTLKRFEFIERNRYAYPNTTVNWNGYTNLRYRIEGNNLFVVPIPQNGQTVRLWYIPAPTSLQFTLPTSLTISSSSATLSDTTGLTVGMNVSGTGIIDGTTLLAVGSTSVQFSTNALTTNPSAILSYWNDSTSLDGIAGWDEYVILGAAIKALIKQEQDFTPLKLLQNEMKERIEAMGEARDAGQAQHVSDALSVQGYGWGGGSGSGDGFGGWGDW